MRSRTRLVGKSILALLFALPLLSSAQTKFQGSDLPVSVTGTSSLHNWEMKSTKASCDAIITLGVNKISFSSLSFAVPVESLKSGHSTMDKNAYRAMNTKKNAGISFVISSVNSITASSANTYKFNGTGKLTIGGVTKLTPMTATLVYNPADKSFTCTGTKTFNMSEYGIKPPTAVLGTIKTGDAISIHYAIRIKS
ncbi:MAG: YceI family protein [Flaviaesturariibacter sp.]|nr:YceI family protein [Flaviaesturariibacter sp.]